MIDLAANHDISVTFHPLKWLYIKVRMGLIPPIPQAHWIAASSIAQGAAFLW